MVIFRIINSNKYKIFKGMAGQYQNFWYVNFRCNMYTNKNIESKFQFMMNSKLITYWSRYRAAYTFRACMVKLLCKLNKNVKQLSSMHNERKPIEYCYLSDVRNEGLFMFNILSTLWKFECIVHSMGTYAPPMHTHTYMCLLVL